MLILFNISHPFNLKNKTIIEVSYTLQVIMIWFGKENIFTHHPDGHRHPHGIESVRVLCLLGHDSFGKS